MTRTISGLVTLSVLFMLGVALLVEVVYPCMPWALFEFIENSGDFLDYVKYDLLGGSAPAWT